MNISVLYACKPICTFIVFHIFNFLNLIVSKNTSKTLNFLTFARFVKKSLYLKKRYCIIKRLNILMKLTWFNAVLVKLISCQKASRQFMIQHIMIYQSQKYLLANIAQKFPLPSLIFCTITKCIMKCFRYLSFIVAHVNFIHKNLPSPKNMWKESIEQMNTNLTFVNIAMAVGMISIIFSDMLELITR